MSDPSIGGVRPQNLGGWIRDEAPDRYAVGVDKVGTGKGYPPPQPTRGSEERHELPNGVRGRAKNDFDTFYRHRTPLDER